jgi:hypothetical protein
MKRFCFLFLFSLIIAFPVFAQQDVDWIFDDTTLPEVHITIDQDSLDQLFTEQGWYSDHEYPATFVFKRETESDTVENIGFRIRGNTSRASQKKSFKVSFNTFVDGREYHGLDKMNLNGEHNDPSIIRSKLSWDLFKEAGIPSSRANHVKVFINGNYYGLYINIEHIDDEFVQDRFGEEEGNLYKSLYPADLTYRGPNGDDYKFEANGRRAYELKTNTEEDDYSDLAFLISFFENASDSKFEREVEDYINVDGVLRWMAVDILTGSWDDYLFNQNNFYLYNNPQTNRFEFIPYDYDNSFGIWWDGIYPGLDWGTRNVLEWGHPDQPRPLSERILSIEKYRNRLQFYINELIEQAFNEDDLFPEIDRIKSLIEDAAEEDDYRTFDYGYSIQDYHNSFEEALGGHVTYGIKPYITARKNSALQQLSVNNIEPVFRAVDFEVTPHPDGFRLNVSAEIVDEETPAVTVYIENSDQSFLLVVEPSSPTNFTYSGSLVLEENIGDFSFYISAEDDQNQTSRYPNNNQRSLSYEFLSSKTGLVINEFQTDNETGIQDESGAFEDWVELYNPTENNISLSGYYLTDDFENPKQWAFPDTSIAPGEYLLLWADNDDEEGPLHTNFGLSNDGEELGLYFQDVLELFVVDSISFGPLADDISYGRKTDGAEEWVTFDVPTPGSANLVSTSNDEPGNQPNELVLFQNYPNPFNPVTTISYQLNASSFVRVEVFSIEGRLVQTLVNERQSSGFYQVEMNASTFASGTYLYRLTTPKESFTRKFILLK